MNTPPRSRTDQEAREILASELERLAPRQEALGEAGQHAVAAWTLEMGYEFEAARLAWKRTVELEPRNAPAHFHLGVCHLELEELPASEAAFHAAIEADAAVAAGEAGEGLDWFEEDPHFKLGNVAHLRGDLDQACAAYERSAALNMTGVEALTELIRCRLVRSEPREALTAIDRLTSRAARLSVRAEAEAYRAEALALLASLGEDVAP